VEYRLRSAISCAAHVSKLPFPNKNAKVSSIRISSGNSARVGNSSPVFSSHNKTSTGRSSSFGRLTIDSAKNMFVNGGQEQIEGGFYHFGVNFRDQFSGKMGSYSNGRLSSVVVPEHIRASD
jgi:hypothetical protein